MKKYIIILFAFISSFAYSQYDFQQLCLNCAEQNGFYCGDDPENWTQYSPEGCVPNNWLNDGWEDCVDASDENEAVPTVPGDCAPPPPPPCDTVYVTEYETIYETLYDTIVNTEYIEIVVVDSIIEYIEIINTEYIDCDTGMPCGSSIQEIVDKSSENSVIYNLQGQAIKVRQGLYIENGKIYYNSND